MKGKIDCSKVFVDISTYASADNPFYGAFIAQDVKKDDLVERGLMKRLGDDFDGTKNPYVFTWSDDIPNYTWAMGSGCSPYYNAQKLGKANTCMVRYYDEDRFEIFATRDISAGEELTHTYKSLAWRPAFLELRAIFEKEK